MNPTVKYKKLDPRAQVPAYATPGADFPASNVKKVTRRGGG